MGGIYLGQVYRRATSLYFSNVECEAMSRDIFMTFASQLILEAMQVSAKFLAQNYILVYRFSK